MFLVGGLELPFIKGKGGVNFEVNDFLSTNLFTWGSRSLEATLHSYSRWLSKVQEVI